MLQPVGPWGLAECAAGLASNPYDKAVDSHLCSRQVTRGYTRARLGDEVLATRSAFVAFSCARFELRYGIALSSLSLLPW
jgi:hypothetical protein